jgi:hypothetical protein
MIGQCQSKCSFVEYLPNIELKSRIFCADTTFFPLQKLSIDNSPARLAVRLWDITLYIFQMACQLPARKPRQTYHFQRN